MPRSNPYDNPKLQRFLKKLEKTKKEILIRTYQRYLPVVPEMIGHIIGIHNGRAFTIKIITPEMIGKTKLKKLGEYSETRRFRGHGKAKGRH
ncbi:MAG: 30S ribosomal protein S19 [Mycoplasmataceae bacterium RC_NB112A]|nr:MAG: 30S ribosomal protein S19 [Mycoplasmataceae bacterium RC_NB112A]